MTVYTVCWLVAVVVFGVVEASTVTLTTIWLAVAALLTAGISALGASVLVQLFSFAVISALLLVFTRPLSKKFLDGKIVPTNADRIINARGVVVKEILPEENMGQIKVRGQIWSAKSNSEEPIATGESIVVLKIEGVCAIVEKAEKLQTV